MQNIKLLIIFILFSSSGYSQSVTPVQINGELFELPGKWEFVTQLKESGQYHFSNKKKDLGIMISVRIASNFDFFDKSLSEQKLVEKFYNWDAAYWSKDHGIKAEVSEVKRNSNPNYIIWKLIVKNALDNDTDVTNYFLYSYRNNNLISISILDNGQKNMPERKMIEFLEKIYLQ